MKTGAIDKSWRGIALLLLFGAASAHAQLYKWVDANGKVNYTDQPPPASVTKVEKKSVGGMGGNDSNLPFEVSEAVRNSPVTLFTSAKCFPCDEARRFLKGRGVPFAEKTVYSNEDTEVLNQAGGGGQLPFLLVGRNRQGGFETGLWNNILTAAGYPESSQLPKDYRFAAAESAAPKPEIVKKADSPDRDKPAEVKRYANSVPEEKTAPPGFQF